jgi:integration host factor subunit beta
LKISQSQFSEMLAAKCGITASQAKLFLDTFKEHIYIHLALGHSVELSGFGQFSVSHRAPRLGVNPRQPSVKITIPELQTPKFKAGEAFKQAVAIKP